LLSLPDIKNHLELARANSLSNRKNWDIYRFCVKKAKEYRQNPIPAPLINGDDLIKLGYAPGPIFNKILQAVNDLQLEGVLQNKEQAFEHIKMAFPFIDDAKS